MTMPDPRGRKSLKERERERERERECVTGCVTEEERERDADLNHILQQHPRTITSFNRIQDHPRSILHSGEFMKR